MARSFNQWKIETLLRLLEIKALHKDNQRVQETVDALITKLHYLKLRDLASFLVLVHHASSVAEEFLLLLPGMEEVQAWFTEEGEEEW